MRRIFVGLLTAAPRTSSTPSTSGFISAAERAHFTRFDLDVLTSDYSSSEATRVFCPSRRDVVFIVSVLREAPASLISSHLSSQIRPSTANMSSTPFPKPAPGQRPPAMRPQVGRLASLKKPIPTPIRRPQPVPIPPPPTKTTTYPKPTTCPNPGCPAPHIVEDDGQKVCAGCGTVISEANIVSEVTFGETSAGAAVVQGTFVGADQSHGRGSGPGFQRAGMESREITEQNGMFRIITYIIISSGLNVSNKEFFRCTLHCSVVESSEHLRRCSESSRPSIQTCRWLEFHTGSPNKNSRCYMSLYRMQKTRL